MNILPPIINDIQNQASLLDVDVEIDNKSLIKDNIYCVSTEHFIGFVHIREDNKEPEFLIFNDSVLKYAFVEGFNINNVYKAFEKRLFTFLTEQEFTEKLFASR